MQTLSVGSYFCSLCIPFPPGFVP